MAHATLSEIDTRIRDLVTRELEWDAAVDASAIGVAAQDGTVTLTGYVDTYLCKLAAERAAKRVRGVRAVANEIEVRPKVGRTDPSILLFASFTLLFQPRALSNPPAQLGEGSGSEVPPGDSDDFDLQAVATDPAARHKLIAAIALNLKQLYFDRAIGQQLADALLAHHRNGDYESLDMPADLAARINRDIQTASRALGIPRGVFVADVVYSARPLPTGPPPPMTEEMRERNRATMLQQNCLFEAVDMRPHNVGYMKLNGFADATVCRETIGRAMASLNNADALIIDLRDNGGGLGDTALQIAGYLFDRPTYMYDPRPNSPVPARTASPIAGNELADKPVYVLTSSSTQSAAEYVVYNLKMLKRATVVGATTAGHQHSGAFHRISDHFGMGIQQAAPPDNPYPVKGWEVIGIEPDVMVSNSEALDAARKLAEHGPRHQ